MAHRFSNTQAQRERVYSKTPSQVSQDIVNAMSSKELETTKALTALDCYAELAHEMAKAITKILKEY